MNPAEYVNLNAAEERMWWFRGMRAMLFGMLDPLVEGREIRRVIEGGCGTGAMTRTLAARYRWECTAVDLSEEGLACAKRSGLERLARADIAKMPFCNASFDAAVSFDVLVYFEKGREAEPLREFARILKPGGLLVLRAAALDVLKSRHSEFVGEKQRFRLGPLAEQVKQAGFRILRATYGNTLLLPVALIKFRLWEPLMRKPVESSVKLGPAWLERLLCAPLALEARWIRAGRDLPVGQSVMILAERLGGAG